MTTDIVPIAKFKARASELVKRARREGRPTVITLNGEAAAVLISPQDFDAQTYGQSIRDAITRGLDDVEAGRTISDEQFKAWANERFGAFAKKTRRRSGKRR